MSVPAVALAETVRGTATDTQVKRVLKAVGEVIVVDGEVGRAAGALLGGSRSHSTIDALVVASAIHVSGGVVLTGDPDDLKPLARHHREVLIEPLQRLTGA